MTQPAPAAGTTTTAASEPPVPPAPLRLLVVDDDEFDRQAVRRCLRQCMPAATADEAASAAEAIQRIGLGTYDCILLDYYLPDRSGPALLQQVRAAGPGIPVVMFTGRGDEEIAVESMKAGAEDYLPKALMTPERLASSLRSALELGRATLARTRAEAALRAQEARFRALANSIPQLAWMADPTGSRHWFNQRWFDYAGATLEELQGWGWQKWHHPDHVHRVTENIRRCFRDGRVWEETHPLRGRDGTYHWFLSRALPIRGEDGAITGWLGTATDVTDRERLFALERDARGQAERAVKARDDVLAIVAHDLRNPIQTISLAASAMLARPVGEKERRQMLEMIQRSVADVEHLIRDLLDVAKIESGNFGIRKAAIPLRPLLEQTVELFGPHARAGDVSLECEIPAADVTVVADRDRLAQVLSNLIGNALKFTPARGRVALRARRSDAFAHIVVADSGAGIPPRASPTSSTGSGRPTGPPAPARGSGWRSARASWTRTAGGSPSRAPSVAAPPSNLPFPAAKADPPPRTPPLPVARARAARRAPSLSSTHPLP